MNSLVSCIFIISSVITLGLGTDLTVSLNNLNSQRTGVYNTLGKSQEKPLNNIRLNEPIRPLSPGLPVDSILEVQLSATEWVWRVRKCGTFACQVLDSRVRSPYDVMVDFEGFANFTDANSNIQINTWYAISQTVPPPPKSGAWISAKAFNLSDFIIPAPINGVSWNLWCMIEVTQGIKASEYLNNPTITFVTQGVEEWIEPGLTLDERTGIINELQSEKH
jgi:hypothetical protein